MQKFFHGKRNGTSVDGGVVVYRSIIRDVGADGKCDGLSLKISFWKSQVDFRVGKKNDTSVQTVES